MDITKLEHSGIAITKDGQTILCDPVEFTTKLPLFQNVVAIVITHGHNDHFQTNVINNILSTNPTARVFTPADTTRYLLNAEPVKAGDAKEIGNFTLKFFGTNHAAIIEEQIPCMNVGVMIDDIVANPGDSFDQPPVTPKVLFAPLSAPWCKVSDTVKYIKDVKPEIVIPFHDAVLSDLGKTFNNNWLKSTCESAGVKFTPLTPGQSITI